MRPESLLGRGTPVNELEKVIRKAEEKYYMFVNDGNRPQYLAKAIEEAGYGDCGKCPLTKEMIDALKKKTPGEWFCIGPPLDAVSDGNGKIDIIVLGLLADTTALPTAIVEFLKELKDE